MPRNGTRLEAPDRDDVRSASTEIARAALRFLLAREEGIPADELPPIRSPIGAVGPAQWLRLVRGARAILFSRFHEAGTLPEWPRLPAGVVEALGRRVALRHGNVRVEPRARPLLAM